MFIRGPTVFSRLRLGFAAASAACAVAVAANLPSPPSTETVDLGPGVTIEFVRVEPGTFVMGSDEEIGDADETPAHRVTLTQPFYLGQYEVTQEQWQCVMGANPSAFPGARRPVDTVSWNDCQQFLARLAQRTGHRFALPTEAQWEFACRAGTRTRWHFGDRDAPMNDCGWVGDNSSGTTHPVGQKRPNALGLYDLYGNVAEWCADWYENPYPKGDATDPAGPAAGTSKIVRGGAWGDAPVNARSASRNANGPAGANNGIGLRCVLLVDEPAPRPVASP